jgi:hypothetical protein
MNGHAACKGSIEDVIVASFDDSCAPLIDLTHNDIAAGPSCAMKGVPTDAFSDECGKNEVTEEDYRYFEHYYRGGRQ